MRLFAAMASAIVVTILIAATAAAQKPGIIKRAGRKIGNAVEQGRQAKEKAKEVVETVTEGAEKTADFWSHVQTFWSQISWRDFVTGRSHQQCLVMGLVMAAVTLFILSEWDNRKNAIALLKGYAAGVVCGFIYELLRTAPDSSAQAGSQSMMVVAALLFAVMAVMHSFRFFPKLKEAVSVRELPYFLWHRQLPPEIIGRQEDGRQSDGEDVVSQPGNGTDSAPTPAPTPPVTPAPPARLMHCPACEGLTEAKAPRCGHCRAFLPKDGGPAVVIVSEATVFCPECGGETEAKAPLCGHCRAPLQEPAVNKARKKKGRTRQPAWKRTF
ncbi:hypothetical protein KJ657_02640 [Patescibacteria group bacterium]|nr:hypothetical protein [Patescibacteria group bacterium]